MSEVHVLWWKYSDGSACGVVRAYLSQERADEDMKLLADSFCGKDYYVTIVPIIGEGAE